MQWQDLFICLYNAIQFGIELYPSKPVEVNRVDPTSFLYVHLVSEGSKNPYDGNNSTYMDQTYTKQRP